MWWGRRRIQFTNLRICYTIYSNLDGKIKTKGGGQEINSSLKKNNRSHEKNNCIQHFLTNLAKRPLYLISPTDFWRTYLSFDEDFFGKILTLPVTNISLSLSLSLILTVGTKNHEIVKKQWKTCLIKKIDSIFGFYTQFYSTIEFLVTPLRVGPPYGRQWGEK